MVKKIVSKKKKGSPKGRKWCFTAFKEDMDWVKIYTDYKDIIRYLIVQKEVCPKTKKPHWQGYIQMYNQCRTRKLKLLFNYMGTHLELARGSAEENKTYCSKLRTSTGEIHEFGKAVTQGFRSDLESIKKCLDDGGQLIDVATSHFGNFIRYHTGFKQYKEMVDKKNRQALRTVKVILKTGPTGTGKTLGTLKEYGMKNVYIASLADGSEWWDGYNGEETILIDDYANDVKINRLLVLLNGVKCRLPIKGSFTWANWRTVVITTNLRKWEIHAKARQAHRDALFRRVTTIASTWPTSDESDDETDGSDSLSQGV